MKSKLTKIFSGLALFLWAAAIHAGELPAFPGAEGFGQFSRGGRGGTVLEVTNLEDNGPGSLREAIETRGPRTIVFRVAGTIALRSELVINHDSVTVAGQSAPGGGICIKNYPLIIDADDVIIRYLRSRLGDEKRQQADALSGIKHKNIIIDHCSFSWGTDEAATLRDNENTTMQWCIISESLNHSIHEKGDHGYGGIWGGKAATFHHNLLAHHASRNPRFNGSRYHGEPDKELIDFRNNVIYNWGFNSGYGGEAGQQNLVNNYYKAGPASEPRNRIVEPWDDKGKWYIAGNYVDGYPEISADNWAGGVQGEHAGAGRFAAPFPAAPVRTQSAEEAFISVLAGVGATLPCRDAVDSRIIAEVRSGSATFGGIWGEKRGLIDSQSQVGGWPELASGESPADADHDGMADEWERRHGLDPADSSDCNGDCSGSGYTNLEKYLNYLTIITDSRH
jgi:hypothetical protein